MKNCLILKKETQLQKASQEDIFSYYKLGPAIDKIIAKQKTNFFSLFCGGASYENMLNKVNDYSRLTVEIPEKFNEAIKNGSVIWGDSKQIVGHYTPNIMQDGKIVGQATLKQSTDMSKISDAVSNIAVMAMLQNIIGKLDVIDEKITEVLKNQKNDWIGDAIGAFVSFADLYPSFNSKEELNQHANHSYSQINTAMIKLFQHMIDLRKELDDCPCTTLQTIKSALFHPTRNIPEEMQVKYSELIGDIQVYNRLLLLKDYLLFIKQGADGTFTKPHQPYFEFCKKRLNDDAFKSTMAYINGRPVKEIDDIINIINKQRHIIENRLSEFQNKTINLEVTKKELLIANK